MKLSGFKNIFSKFFLSLAFIALMTSCVAEDLSPDCPGSTDQLEDGYALRVKVSLSSMSGNTRAGIEDYEDYINEKNLRIMFFYGNETNKDNYNTLIKQFKITSTFDSHNITFIPVEASGSNFSKDWYLNIPIKGEELEEFAQKLRDNPFKVAVLANWPMESVTALDEFKEETKIINEDESEQIEPGDHIDKLHHIYSDNKMAGDFYSFLRKNENVAKMSYTSDWVKEADVLSQYGADTFIRQKYGLGNQVIEDVSKDQFGDLWLIWNFDGAMKLKTEGGPEAYGTNVFKEDWYDKNRRGLYDNWLAKVWEETEDKVLTTYSVPEKQDFSDSGNFHFEGGTSFLAQQNGKYGIVLRPGERDANNGNKILTDYIRFNIPNSGTLKIHWGSYDENEAKLTIEHRNHDTDSEDKDKDNNVYSSSDSSTIKETEVPYGITGDAEFIYLVSDTGNVIIYDIEYISTKYLEDTWREARTPQDVGGIPMYGIQSYPALGTYWPAGTVFDLNNFNHIEELGDNFKSIHLLRSVAKVELKIPKTLEPHHVYLRSMNRKASCEPLDVSTPTDQLWKDDIGGSHNTTCEFFDILGHEPFYTKYDPKKPEASVQVENYRKKLSWYYGNWAVNGSLGNVEVPAPGYGNSKTVTKYPQIMNVSIDRSDFAEFIKTGSDSYYDRYVIYVPEKFVDDPSSVGDDKEMETTTPKVCHIEFRRKDDPYDNVDDNNCYRIYFTEGGFNKEMTYPTFGKSSADGKGKDDDNWEKSYEQVPSNLQKHWPIIRNHLYSFTVIDEMNRMLVVKLEVLPWRKIEYNDGYQW